MRMSQHRHDLSIIERMLRKVRDLVPHVSGLPFHPGPVSLSFRDGDGRGHRLVVLRPQALGGSTELALVGFFGERRGDVSDAPLHRVDSELIDELAGHPGIVSYSSLDLGASSGANLVLATDRVTLERWQRSERHAFVARELAPRHYAAIRIHTGSVPGGLGAGRPAEIASTRELSFLAA
jgi:hypothetical protein